MSANGFHLVGRLAKDPEVLTSKAGKQYVKLLLETKEKKGQGYESEYHPLTVFGKTAEYVSQNAQLGTALYAEGRIESREYKEKYYTGLSAFRVEVFKPLDNEVDTSYSQTLVEDDVPF